MKLVCRMLPKKSAQISGFLLLLFEVCNISVKINHFYNKEPIRKPAGNPLKQHAKQNGQLNAHYVLEGHA